MKRCVTIWSESGGVGKTTITTNTAAALARNGHDVLAIDLDPQAGGLTDHMGFLHLHDDDDHYAGKAIVEPDTHDLRDYIVDAEEFDLLPSHERYANIGATINERPDIHLEGYQLKRAMQEVYGEYDYILIDPQASLNTLVDNALIATQNVIAPIELTRKGKVSGDGLVDTLTAMEDGYQAQNESFLLNLLAFVPNETDQKKITKKMRADIEASGHPITPFDITEKSVFGKAWDAHRSIYGYRDADNRIYDYEEEAFDIFDQLARLIEIGDLSELTPLDEDEMEVLA